jgi:hypothetical protein
MRIIGVPTLPMEKMAFVVRGCLQCRAIRTPDGCPMERHHGSVAARAVRPCGKGGGETISRLRNIRPTISLAPPKTENDSGLIRSRREPPQKVRNQAVPGPASDRGAATEQKNSEYQPGARSGRQLAHDLGSLRRAVGSARGIVPAIAETVKNARSTDQDENPVARRPERRKPG